MDYDYRPSEDLVTGDRFWITESDTAPIVVSEGEVECAAQFTYLGSVVSACRRIYAEVDYQIARASRAFGALQCTVFKDHKLSVATKCRINEACVLSVVLYSSEYWTPGGDSLEG